MVDFQRRTNFLKCLRKGIFLTTVRYEQTTCKHNLNPLGIQLLSPNLHQHIFGCSLSIPEETKIQESIKHLKQHKLWGKETTRISNVDVQLPQLMGENISEHFHELGTRYSKVYRCLAENLVSKGLPVPPERWEFRSGWTRYDREGMQAVDFPLERGLVLDVEICLDQEGHFPTLATAASTEAWYSWCSQRLVSENFSWSEEVTLNDLIPLETAADQTKLPTDHEWREILMVGHNVAFDRSFIREQYFVDGTKQRFLDTMSLHTCVSGQSGVQRNMTMASKSIQKRNEVNLPAEMAWMGKTSLNNLADVYSLYCKGNKPLDKEPRDVFVQGTLEDVRNNFQDLTSYCSRDVQATHGILQKILPLFFGRFPHPVTLAGMLEMSVTYLPVNRLWKSYLQRGQETYDDKQRELKLYLGRIADEACALQQDQRLPTNF